MEPNINTNYLTNILHPKRNSAMLWKLFCIQAHFSLLLFLWSVKMLFVFGEKIARARLKSVNHIRLCDCCWSWKRFSIFIPNVCKQFNRMQLFQNKNHKKPSIWIRHLLKCSIFWYMPVSMANLHYAEWVSNKKWRLKREKTLQNGSQWQEWCVWYRFGFRSTIQTMCALLLNSCCLSCCCCVPIVTHRILSSQPFKSKMNLKR